jgi:hypothetical protein
MIKSRRVVEVSQRQSLVSRQSEIHGHYPLEVLEKNNRSSMLLPSVHGPRERERERKMCPWVEVLLIFINFQTRLSFAW